MRSDHLSTGYVRKIARRLITRRLSAVASAGKSELRQPDEGETPLSYSEVLFAIEHGLVFGPEDIQLTRRAA